MSAPSSSSSSSSPVGPPVALDVPSLVARLAQLESYINQVGQQNQQLLQHQAANAAQANSNVVAAQVAHSSGPRPKAPPMNLFNGTMGNSGFAVDQWLREVDKQFTHYGPSTFPNDESKITYAVTWLTGSALDWWESEARDHLAEHQTPLMQAGWKYFVERLRDRYRPQLPAELARQRLRYLVQKGRVETYCNAFLSLVAHIPDRVEADKIFDFKNGLDRPLAAKVAEKHPKTLQEAMEIAIQAEPYVGHRSGSNGAGFSYRGSGALGNASARSASNNGLFNNSGSVPMDLNLITDAAVGSNQQSGADDQGVAGVSHSNSSENPDALQLLVAKLNSIEHRVQAMTQPRAKVKSNDRVPGLTAADIAQLQKEGRCFRCRQQGHMKSECPQARLKY